MRDCGISIAVIGVGYLGRFHAEKLAAMKDVRLTAVVDVDLERAREIARSVKTRAFASHEEILEDIDAAVIAAPTEAHARIAEALLRAGKDVLCEKPMTATRDEADALVRLTEEFGRILQVGHLERFNPAVEGLLEQGRNVLFIEAVRIAPFKGRGMDVDVALDLMSHDLDIVLTLVGENPCEIRASGVPVLGRHPDIVNARLEFPGGCVANLTASRLALKDERKMRVFQPDAYMSVDFRKRRLLVVNNVEFRAGILPKVKTVRPRFGAKDPLEEELKSFVRCITERSSPRVDGEQGRAVLKCALNIRDLVNQNLARREGLLALSPRWVDAKWDKP
jgi:predicted dehydrogenase